MCKIKNILPVPIFCDTLGEKNSEQKLIAGAVKEIKISIYSLICIQQLVIEHVFSFS